MPLIGNYLDFKAEIASKKEYNPPAEIKEYADAQLAEWSWDFQSFQKQYKPFNNRSFFDYLSLSMEDTYKFSPAPVDPNDWRNFIRSGDERNGLDALLSFLQDLNFRCEPAARDWLGSLNKDMSDVSESFLRYINVLDETVDKDPISDLAMFSTGTLFKQVKYTVRQGVDKIGAKWKDTDPITSLSYAMREYDEFEGVESTIWKPNRVFLSDVSEPNYKKQDHVWAEMVVPYAVAYKIAHNWAQWPFVKPYNASYDQWTDTDLDTETEDTSRNDKVRIRFRESPVTNETSIYFNKVLMTPPGLPLPEGHGSIFYQQAAMLDPKFAYGRSYMDNVRRFVAVKDVLTSILVDKSRQILEPPLKSRFRTMVNRYMFKPATVTPMQGEGDLTPLIPESAMNNFVFEALKVYEAMIDKANPTPGFQGEQKGQKTKREVEMMLAESIRAVASSVEMACAWRRKESEMKLRIGLEHFTKMTGFKFESAGDNGSSSRVVEFGAMPTSKTKYQTLVRKMKDAQNIARKNGENKQHYFVDKATIKDYTFVIDFRVNPQQRDSRGADEEAVERKIAAYRSDPQNINQRAVSKLLVRMNNDDETELLNPEPQAQPQQGQGMQQPNAPQNPAQAQSAPQNGAPQPQQKIPQPA